MSQPNRMKLGIIPGAIKEPLQADPKGTLAQLAQMGYQGVEVNAGFPQLLGCSASQCPQVLGELGLEAMSLFANWGDYDTQCDKIVQAAKEMGCSYTVWGWSPADDPQRMEAEVLPVMRKAAAAVKSAGLTLLYHNHDHEFKGRNGDEIAYDWLMRRFEPDELAAELDVGWVAYGGQDVAETIQRYAGRCPILHMRDVGDPATRGAFTEIGTGTLDIPGILKAGATVGGSTWAVVEHSKKMNHEPMEGLRIAADNILSALASH